MDNDQVEIGIRQQIRVVQIIAIALMMGVLTFGAIAFQIGNGKQPPETPMMSYIAMGLGLQMLIVHFIIPSFILKNSLKAIANQTGNVREALVATHRGKTILGLAILEGAAFLALVSYLIEGHDYALGTALVMLFMMTVQFPGTNRVLNWIGTNAELIEQQRNTSS